MGTIKGKRMNTELAVAISSVCGVVVAAIIKFVPRRSNGKATNGMMTEKLCNEKGKVVEERINNLKEDIGELKEDVKSQGKTLSEVHTILLKMNGDSK